jgi:hypothetical protein
VGAAKPNVVNAGGLYDRQACLSTPKSIKHLSYFDPEFFELHQALQRVDLASFWGLPKDLSV